MAPCNQSTGGTGHGTDSLKPKRSIGLDRPGVRVVLWNLDVPIKESAPRALACPVDPCNSSVGTFALAIASRQSRGLSEWRAHGGSAWDGADCNGLCKKASRSRTARRARAAARFAAMTSRCVCDSCIDSDPEPATRTLALDDASSCLRACCLARAAALFAAMVCLCSWDRDADDAEAEPAVDPADCGGLFTSAPRSRAAGRARAAARFAAMRSRCVCDSCIDSDPEPATGVLAVDDANSCSRVCCLASAAALAHEPCVGGGGLTCHSVGRPIAHAVLELQLNMDVCSPRAPARGAVAESNYIGGHTGLESGLRLHYLHKKQSDHMIRTKHTHLQITLWKAMLLQKCHAKRSCESSSKLHPEASISQCVAL